MILKHGIFVKFNTFTRKFEEKTESSATAEKERCSDEQ